MVRRCNKNIWGAALFGHDGTMWGQDGLPADGLAKIKSEVRFLVSVLSAEDDTDEQTRVFTSGFKFLERDWACVRIEHKAMMAGKGKAPNTAQFCARMTGRCLIIALANPEGSNTNAVSGAMQVGDFLEESGY